MRSCRMHKLNNNASFNFSKKRIKDNFDYSEFPIFLSVTFTFSSGY